MLYPMDSLEMQSDEGDQLIETTAIFLACDHLPQCGRTELLEASVRGATPVFRSGFGLAL